MTHSAPPGRPAAWFPSMIGSMACLVALVAVSTVEAQQVTVGTPLRGASHGFYEHFGLGFGFRQESPNGFMFFRSGGAGWPPYGGGNPANANTFGIGGRKGDFSWNLNLSMAQSSSSSSGVVSPSLTLPHGGYGFIQSTVQRPFVVGFVPVVNEQVVEQQRSLVQQQYENAAQEYVRQRQAQREKEAAELASLRKASEKKRTSSAGRAQPDDPPLRLGRKPRE